MTGLYRFLTKSGGFVWMDTTATLITNQRTDKAVSVVCVHNVVRFRSIQLYIQIRLCTLFRHT